MYIENLKDVDKYYFVSSDPSEIELKTNRYIVEEWKYDGEFYRKVTNNSQSTVEVPPLSFTIPEFHNYVTRLVKFKDFTLERRPTKDREFKLINSS